MKVKSLILSAALFAAASSGIAAQSLLDLPDLLRRQTSTQDNPVKVEYNIDFHYFTDIRNFDACDEIFMLTNTYTSPVSPRRPYFVSTRTGTSPTGLQWESISRKTSA